MANDNNLHVYFPWIFKQEQQKNEACTETNTHPVICAFSINSMKELQPNNECSFKESLSDSNTDTEADNNLKTYINHQLDSNTQSDCETDNISTNETSDTQQINADREESRSSFKNSTSINLTDNKSDIESFLFKANAVSSIDNSWRTATIFSILKTFENEKFISDELIYKAMAKLNMTSKLFVTGGFRKPNV